MVALHRHHASQSCEAKFRVHIGVLPAMTGVSRFLELNPAWHYNKVSPKFEQAGHAAVLSMRHDMELLEE